MKSRRKRQYTKTQMRLSSFPAREKPDFPKQDLPPIEVEETDGANVGAEAPVADVGDTVPSLAPAAADTSIPVETGLESEPLPSSVATLTRQLRPLDPWRCEEGPAEWVEWFQAHGRPSRLLARAGLSWIPEPQTLIEELEHHFAEAELEGDGFDLGRLDAQHLSRALVFPLRSGRKIHGLEARLPDGEMLFRVPQWQEDSLIYRPFALGDFPRGTSLLVSDHFLWVLEELALGLPAVYIEQHGNLPRWWPQEFERYETLLAFRQPEKVGQQRLEAQFSSWGVHARRVSDRQRQNHLITVRAAGEAAEMVQPPEPDRPPIVDKIREILHRSLPRWFRHDHPTS